MFELPKALNILVQKKWDKPKDRLDLVTITKWKCLTHGGRATHKYIRKIGNDLTGGWDRIYHNDLEMEWLHGVCRIMKYVSNGRL